MRIETEINDINGTPLQLGDTVLAYAQEYEEVSRDESCGVPIAQVDTARPKPLKDVPLFKGRIEWDAEQMALQIRIEQVLVNWEPKPAVVQMGGYVYEKLDGHAR